VTGKLQIEIMESVETLSNLLKKEKNPQNKERIQALYWIKTNLAETIGHLSALSGKHRTTVSRWCGMHWAAFISDFKFEIRPVKLI
jgi:hypothetical protein